MKRNLSTEVGKGYTMSAVGTYLSFQDCAVPADSVEDFLERYYKHERYKGRGEEVRKNKLLSYKKQFIERGFCSCSHHDNVTGRFITFYGKNFKIK